MPGNSVKSAFCIYLVFIMISCAEKEQEKVSTNSIDTVAKSSAKKDTQKIISTVTANDTIVAKFLKDSVATTIKGLLKEAPQNVVIYIDIKQGKNLSATLNTKDPKANIRINQVFTPDGKADGPFGKEVSRPILKQGMYKLIVGHDLMAEGGSAVKFELRLVVR